MRESHLTNTRVASPLERRKSPLSVVATRVLRGFLRNHSLHYAMLSNRNHMCKHCPFAPALLHPLESIPHPYVHTPTSTLALSAHAHQPGELGHATCPNQRQTT